MSAVSSTSALVQDCPLQKTWSPIVSRCVSGGRTWNNWTLTGQGSNSASSRSCRVSRRRPGHVVSRAVDRALRRPFCLVIFTSNSYCFCSERPRIGARCLE
ncbi:hypothetical protein SCLCIDRAFT_691095 [Scleroderma citrinum Foug A]|uniref:Uncharacterized protein n=1 Tax=Scleroderma citrinum Foug A TaxID=1036808 RepID=A0A0C3E732_9AGAM|nr:hypothetical protein SCLCIDRAFT_691095 [Scleroderma citrinum Foug A]